MIKKEPLRKWTIEPDSFYIFTQLKEIDIKNEEYLFSYNYCSLFQNSYSLDTKYASELRKLLIDDDLFPYFSNEKYAIEQLIKNGSVFKENIYLDVTKNNFYSKSLNDKHNISSRQSIVYCPKCGHFEHNEKFKIKKNKQIENLWNKIELESPEFYLKHLQNTESIYDSEKIYQSENDSGYSFIYECPKCQFRPKNNKTRNIKNISEFNDPILNSISIYQSESKVSLVFYYKRFFYVNENVLYNIEKNMIIINTTTGNSYFIGNYIKEPHKNFDFKQSVIKNITYRISFKEKKKLNDFLTFCKKSEKNKDEIQNIILQAIIENKKNIYQLNLSKEKINTILNQQKNKQIITKNNFLNEIFYLNKMPILYQEFPDFCYDTNNLIETIKNTTSFLDYDDFDEDIQDSLAYYKIKDYQVFYNKVIRSLTKKSYHGTMEDLKKLIIIKYNIPETKKMKKKVRSDMNTLINYILFKKAGFRDINNFYAFLDSDFPFFIYLSNLPFIKDLIKTRGENNVCRFLIKNQKDYEEGCYSKGELFFDCIQLHSYIKKVFPIEPQYLLGNIQEVHDNLTQLSHIVKNINYKIVYSKNELDLEKEYNNLNFMLAPDTDSLVDCGIKMKICVGSYKEKVLQKKCVILFLKEEQDYKCCIEIQNKKLLQAKYYCNKKVPDEIGIILLDWIKANKIDYKECPDVNHLL